MDLGLLLVKLHEAMPILDLDRCRYSDRILKSAIDENTKQYRNCTNFHLLGLESTCFAFGCFFRTKDKFTDLPPYRV